MDVIYLSDAEIAKRLNISAEKAKMLRGLPDFPPPDPLVGKRFWPAVEAWLFRRYGIDANMSVDQQPDGKENWS